MKFEIVYPVKVNGQYFSAIITKENKKYLVELSLGDNIIDRKELSGMSLREVVARIKQGMEKYFYTELPRHVKESKGIW